MAGPHSVVPTVEKLREFLAKKNARDPFSVFYVPTPGKKLAQLELLYHPALFKTAKCDKDAACKYGALCAFYHSSTEELEQQGATRLRTKWVKLHTQQLRELPPKNRVGKFSVEDLLNLVSAPSRKPSVPSPSLTPTADKSPPCPKSPTMPPSSPVPPPLQSSLSSSQPPPVTVIAPEVLAQDKVLIQKMLEARFPKCIADGTQGCLGYSVFYCSECTTLCRNCDSLTHRFYQSHTRITLNSAMCMHCQRQAASYVCLMCEPLRIVCSECEQNDIPHKLKRGSFDKHCFLSLDRIFTKTEKKVPQQAQQVPTIQQQPVAQHFTQPFFFYQNTPQFPGIGIENQIPFATSSNVDYKNGTLRFSSGTAV